MTPPIADSSTASSRNCRSTSRRRAPMASRTPISRVRSVTLISITLAIPMPPMNRLMPASPTVTAPIAALTRSNCAMIWSDVDRLKSFSWVGPRRRNCRRITSVWTRVSSRRPGFDFTYSTVFSACGNRRVAVPSGIDMTLSFRFSPKNPPFLAASSPTM